MRKRRTDDANRYSAPVSPERQERLQKLYNRDAMRQWAKETGVGDKVLELIISQVRERQGLSPDPKTWRLIPAEDAGGCEIKTSDAGASLIEEIELRKPND